MSETHGFFGASTDPRYYSQISWLPFVQDFREDGYIPGSGSGGELLVSASSPAAMTVSVAAGDAWVQGCHYISDAAVTLTIDAAETALNRIDRIVLRNDIRGARTITLAVLKGTPAISPSGTDLTRTADMWELCIASVYIAAGVTSITAGNITDRRDDVTFCGKASPKAVRYANIMSGAALDMNGYLIKGVATPASAQDGVNLAYRNTRALQEPIGIVDVFAGSTIPTGWLECTGAAVSRTTYAALFAVIGTTFGAGDGSTTFNTPDLRGRSVVGYKSTDSNFNAIGKTGGTKTHTLTIAELPAHTHTGCPAITVTAAGATSTASSYASETTATSGSAGTGGSHNNLPPYIVMKMIIKAVA